MPAVAADFLEADFDMTRTSDNPWLHRFALLLALATFALIGVGGLVTSHEAGMAVPDWPTTYGYNMFLFPISKWVGGVMYEHSHRLVASGVGFLMTILALWLWLKEERVWLRRLGVIAFFAVVLQGVLGGLRVTLYKDELGIFHATLAQLFFALTCAIALFTSRTWLRMRERIAINAGLRGHLLGTTILILVQLMLGATMRHQHAGLAVRDFPLAYGKVWPATDVAAVERINAERERSETRDFKPVTAAQIKLHMVHRIVAVLILAAVAAFAMRTRKLLGGGALYSRLAMAWLGLILVQASLGAWTVWSNKAADIATLHVSVGAASLAMGTMLTIIAFRNVTAVTAGALAKDKVVAGQSQSVASVA